MIDSAHSLSIRGESGDGDEAQRKRKIMGRAVRVIHGDVINRDVPSAFRPV